MLELPTLELDWLSSSHSRLTLRGYCRQALFPRDYSRLTAKQRTFRITLIANCGISYLKKKKSVKIFQSKLGLILAQKL